MGLSRAEKVLLHTPCGELIVLRAIPAETCCAWALCSRSEHGNVFLYCRFRDSPSYLLGRTWLLLCNFVTIAFPCDSAPSASYYVPSSRSGKRSILEKHVLYQNGLYKKVTSILIESNFFRFPWLI